MQVKSTVVFLEEAPSTVGGHGYLPRLAKNMNTRQEAPRPVWDLNSQPGDQESQFHPQSPPGAPRATILKTVGVKQQCPEDFT